MQLYMMFAYDQNQSLGYLTALSSRLLSRTLTSRFQSAGIDMTAEQWGAILVVVNGEATTQSDVGKQLCLEKSSVSRLLNGLEWRGWIERTKDPKDSRQKLINPTPQTLETIERCAFIARDILENAQHGTTEEEQSAGQSFLLRIITNLNNKEAT